jgi:glutamate/tyrosine decarboxylase-like PLP-dependent enzyme
MQQTIDSTAAAGSDGESLDQLEARYGGHFLRHEAPSETLPSTGMPAVEAMRLVAEELVIEGAPMRNLATFVTTWMEPEAQRLIAANLHRNFIDHAEYPRTAELEQRCIGCSRISSMPPGRRRVRGRKAPPRRSCWAPCR